MAALRVVNPATLQTVGETPLSTAEDVARAHAAARAAQPAWAASDVRARLAVVARFQSLVLRDRDELATLVSREMGKPFSEALAADLLPLLDACAYVREAAPRVLSPRRRRLRNLLLKDRTSRVAREPVGVVGIVSPWNYPLAIPGGQTVFALAAGNSVVVKPASLTPLVLLRVAELWREAGLPEGLLAVVVGPGGTVGKAMTSLPFDHLVFTGSDAVGREVERACAARDVACTLELGGSDPAIVLDDADLERASSGIVWARFTNAGQTCAAAKRVIVLESVAQQLTDLVAEKARRLRLGDPLAEDTDVGPLAYASAVAEMRAFVEDAEKRGATVLVGGDAREEMGGYFFEPTVLADVPPDARVLTEEVFGPVLPIVRATDEEEAIHLANATRFGLTASVWTRDRARGRRVASRLDAGTVTINDHVYTFAAMETPWGGVKSSGKGATHGLDGLLAVTRPKHVNESPARPLWPTLWWFPYERANREGLRDGLPFLYGTGLGRFARAPKIVWNLLRKRN